MKKTNNYVFFWNGIYSQWDFWNMTIDGITFNCCEQYMMYQKAVFFEDYEIARRILHEVSPREQKSLGRQIKGFDREKWDKACVGFVFKGNYAKFTQNEVLKRELLETGDRILVEASPKDFIWGIGMHEDDAGVENPGNWKGTNLLGWTITLVKKEIQSEQ